MILTETYYGKICALMLPKEKRVLEETLNQTRGVLQQSHSKGVELESILEVRPPDHLTHKNLLPNHIWIKHFFLNSIC